MLTRRRAGLGAPRAQAHGDTRCALVSAGELLGAPVRAGDLAVGAVDDVLLTRDLLAAVGCSVRRASGESHLLPWLAGRVERRCVRVRRRLSVLELDARAGVRLTELTGVRLPGGGTVADVLVDPLARVVGVVVGHGSRARVVGPGSARRLLQPFASGGAAHAQLDRPAQGLAPLAHEAAEREA